MSPFVCNMSAIAPDERPQHVATIRQVFAATQEIQELPDGYTFRLPNDALVLLKIAEFITRERLCCPFLGFAVEVEEEGGPVWLRLTGREGAKAVIRAELSPVVSKTVAQAANFV